MAPVTASSFSALADLDDWRFVLGAVHAEFGFASFAAAGEFVAAVAAAADAADHHPEVTLRYPGRVRVSMRSHDSSTLTTRDVNMARTVSTIARDAHATTDPTHGQALEIAIDTMDASRIRPFWAAVLGYVEVGDNALADRDHFGPGVWFQQMDEPRDERQRFHIDVSVPHDVAEARVAATIAAGGRLVTDEFARSWWILADADGNEACVCTWQDRG
jgi:4a-hydroxytetrahydrobiopterin dehydratase